MLRPSSAKLPHAVLLPQGDIVLRVTNTCICGSDLHLYLRGMPGMKTGDVLGHEVRGTPCRVVGG